MSGMVVPCGELDRPTYILNGTLIDGIALDVEDDATAELYDTFGRAVGTQKLKRGIQRVPVPKSGYMRIEKSREP